MLFLPGRECYVNPKQSGLQTYHHWEYQINRFVVRHAWKSPCINSSHCTDWSFPITQWHRRRKANQSMQVSGPTQTHLRPRIAPHTMRVKCWTSSRRTCLLDFCAVGAEMAQLVPLGLLKMVPHASLDCCSAGVCLPQTNVKRFLQSYFPGTLALDLESRH